VRVATKSTVGALTLILFSVACTEEEATGPSGAEVVAERSSRPEGAAQASLSRATDAGPGLDPVFLYDGAGRRDPFEPYRVVEQSREDLGAGPLAQFDLEQLAVVALVWDGAVAKAMVSDPAGTTYTIGLGSRMGKNEGRVIHIGDNLVLVKETYVDYAGNESTKDVHLMIRSSRGG
jgi:Tfp pilus assembly protein PilP